MNQQLANRFREVILHGTWIANTNWEMELSDVDFQMATLKYLSLNSIADLTFHITYYIKGINHFFKTGNLEIKDNLSFNRPEILSETDWQLLKTELFNQAELFAQHIESLPKETLESDFFDPKYGTYLRNIEGQIEHSYYHLGQVVIIKKLLNI